jgi:formate C-acetyltransferase
MAVEYAEEARAARRRNAERKKRASSAVPTPFTSALMRGCVRRGKDMLIGMEYHVSGLYERQLTDATNAVAAIDELVFEERTFSMSELVAAMRRDFEEEAASVRERLLAAPKWGNDDDRVDGFAIELLEMRERALGSVDIEFGDPSHTVCHVVRSLHHIDGKGIAASPDGRLAETPVADSVGAKIGTAREGPTAMLNSVLKIDASRYYRGGYNLNLTLSTATASQEVVLALVEAFFGDGGQELQVNVLDAAGLRDAQQNPERYRDLVVRVAGFSARFVDLSLAEQEEIIRRAEAVELGR